MRKLPAKLNNCSATQPELRQADAEIEEFTDPVAPLEEPDEPSDLDELEDVDGPCTDEDSRWDAFIPDDDELDPLPDPGDFWTAQD